MSKVVFCKKCGLFKCYQPEELILCPVCNNELIFPMTNSEFEKMSLPQLEAYPFKVQPPEAYDEESWEKRYIEDVELAYNVHFDPLGKEIERRKKENSSDIGIGFIFPL